MSGTTQARTRHDTKRDLQTLKWSTQALAGTAFVFLPRIAPGLLTLACAYCCVRIPPTKYEMRRLLYWTALVAAYPALTALWALEQRRTLTIIATCVAISVASILVFRRSGSLKGAFWPALAYGYPAIVLVSLIDVALDIPIRTLAAEMGLIWVGQPRMVEKGVHQAAINWSMAIMALSIFPYLNVTRQASRGIAWKQSIRVAVVVALLLTAFLSTHESSKLALCAGAAVYAIARSSKRLALALMMIAWLVSIAATPLIVSAVLPLTKEIANEVQHSLQQRFKIWDVALKDIAAHPWKGTGIGSTRATFRKKAMNKKIPFTGIAAHSHSWFLDLWRELGAIGAAFAVVWVAMVAQRLFARLPEVSPEFIAFTGLVLVMSTSSFSLWAPWYLCAIGLSFAMFGLTKSDLRPSAEAEPLAQQPRRIAEVLKRGRMSAVHVEKACQ